MRNEVGNFQPALLGKIQSALTRSHTKMRSRPFAHVIVCIGDEAVRLGDAIVLI